jgi:hypothetical protein
VGDNPINLIDPIGLCPCPECDDEYRKRMAQIASDLTQALKHLGIFGSGQSIMAGGVAEGLGMSIGIGTGVAWVAAGIEVISVSSDYLQAMHLANLQSEWAKQDWNACRKRNHCDDSL